ncbi:MAG: aminodeoxychorismate/anthranilate synthase component II [Saprospiraceae bacterium]|nr:aminodeoxychorismate/anthranilate synthase component II [Saprospiraceae bacterium]
MKILVIDNYDSFTYNLVYILRKEYPDTAIFRNDKITPEQCLAYDSIILSPGPGIPRDAGNLCSIIESCAGKVPILGVCLGHQAIAEYLGGKIRMLEKVYHGVQSLVRHTNDPQGIFDNIPDLFHAGRYHSWDVISNGHENFQVTAFSEDECIMAIQNSEMNLYGIQFHPESILTPQGETIVKNYLRISENHGR